MCLPYAVAQAESMSNVVMDVTPNMILRLLPVLCRLLLSNHEIQYTMCKKAMNKTKKSGHPKVSLIMPFFNNKELVSKMIDSIRANTFEDWELLAIDDGSSNDTLEYLSSFQKDKRIIFIKRETMPKGAQTCRNLGMDYAKGEFLISPVCLLA